MAALDKEPLDISSGAAAGLSAGARELLAALERHGALHLNSTPRFPNVSDLDGAWRDAMDLVAGKHCYLSRLVGGKTTYLSLRKPGQWLFWPAYWYGHWGGRKWLVGVPGGGVEYVWLK